MIMLHWQDEKLKQRGVKRKKTKKQKHYTKYTQELTVTSINEYLGGIKDFNSQDNSNFNILSFDDMHSRRYFCCENWILYCHVLCLEILFEFIEQCWYVLPLLACIVVNQVLQ